MWLLPEQLPLPFPQSDGSAVDVHINMEQAPVQVLRGLGGSGKGIWEKEAVRWDRTWLRRCWDLVRWALELVAVFQTCPNSPSLVIE